MTRTPASRRTSVMLVVGTAVVLLAGCTPEPAPEPAPTATVAESPSPTATTPAAPALVADGTAEDNLPYFAQIVQSVWAGPDQVHGRAYIDALTAAGFDKSAMQVTEDESTVGNPAESIQFSVRWGDECLVGQVGPATGSPVAVVQPVLQDGTCLIGTTRVIDW
ncbi:DUF6993 domain-containing protein [Microbacterium sp. NPDC091313]